MKTITISCLKLSLTPYFGYARFLESQRQGINPNDLVSNLERFRKVLKIRQESIDFLLSDKYQEYIEMCKKWCEIESNHIISYFDDEYPEQLKETATPPLVLYAKGDIKLLKNKQLSIVGARNYSQYGEDVTRKIIKELSIYDITITSGLAFGIDTLAHRNAIQNNMKTIAVIGTGIDVYYPANNRQLQDTIAKDHLLISEFTFGTQPLKQNFPQRNRIISALADGVLVIEAAQKSGSLITAHSALEQNREVFAVPGSIFSKTSIGCNDLIRQGAKPVCSGEDIIEEIGHVSSFPTTALANDLSVELSHEVKIVYECVSEKLTSIDQIVAATQIPYQTISTTLFNLEINNLIKSVPGGYMKIQN